MSEIIIAIKYFLETGEFIAGLTSLEKEVVMAVALKSKG
jgi:hypothetical protein